MAFSKIFKIFLLFFALNCIGAPKNPRTFSLNLHCDLQFTPTNELMTDPVLEYAKKINSEMVKILPENHRAGNKKTRRNFTIIFTDNPANNMSVTCNKQNITIKIDGISSNFQSDYVFLRNFFTAITLQAMPYENEDVRTNWKLPHWIFLALHSKIKSAFGGTKILRSSNIMPGLRIFLEKNFFPDPLLIEQCNGENMSAVELLFIQDYCRFIMYLSSMFSKSGKNAVGAYLRELYLSNNSADPAVFQRLIINPLQQQAQIHLKRMCDLPELYKEKQQLEMFFKFHAGHVAFSYSSPSSSNYLALRFNEFKQIRFAELDAANMPTGKIIESTISELPQLIKKYPYIKTMINLKRGELLYFRSISSSIFLHECNDLLKLLGNIKDSRFFGTSTRKLRQAVRKIEQKIDMLEKIEKNLEQTEASNLSPFQIFPYEFFAEKEYRNATVPARFIEDLEKAEKEYLK